MIKVSKVKGLYELEYKGQKFISRNKEPIKIGYAILLKMEKDEIPLDFYKHLHKVDPRCLYYDRANLEFRDQVDKDLKFLNG